MPPIVRASEKDVTWQLCLVLCPSCHVTCTLIWLSKCDFVFILPAPISLFYRSQNRGKEELLWKRRENNIMSLSFIIDYVLQISKYCLRFFSHQFHLLQPKNYYGKRIENICHNMSLLLIMQDYAIHQNVVDNAKVAQKETWLYMLSHAEVNTRWSDIFWYY